LDVDGLTAACATSAEEAAARRAGFRVVRVGLGATGVPAEGRLVSFGLAGALADGLATGEVLDATRVVDVAGNVLWEGGPLGARGARTGTLLAADAIVDDAGERRRLHARTGADAADLESGPLARTGRLAGCLRAISDTPREPLGALAAAVRPDGTVRWPRLLRAVVTSPRETVRAARAARRALRRLEALGA
jgi:adenosylhomocysteine nucleosidase